MDIKLLPMSAADVLKYVNYSDSYIKPAMETGTGETTYESLVGKALTEKAIFWMAFNEKDEVVGMASTEIMQFPAYRSVHLITIGGIDGFGFEKYHKFLEDYAKFVGAKDIQFWGRKGWSRAIDKVTGNNDEKYKETYRVFSMEIKND
jgi:hypothetical protein